MNLPDPRSIKGKFLQVPVFEQPVTSITDLPALIRFDVLTFEKHWKNRHTLEWRPFIDDRKTENWPEYAIGTA